MMFRHRTRGDNGFTLLELLVAIVLLSLMMVVLFTGFRIGMRSWDSADSTINRTEELRLVQGVLRRIISQTVPLLRRDQGRWEVQFDGTPQSLHFVAEFAPYFGKAGLREVTIKEHSSDGGLMLRSTLLHPDLESRPTELHRFESVLIDDELKLRFFYFGSKNNDAPRWHDLWAEGRRIPDLIRISDSTGTERIWPSLDVALDINGNRFGVRRASTDAAIPEETLEPDSDSSSDSEVVLPVDEVADEVTQ